MSSLRFIWLIFVVLFSFSSCLMAENAYHYSYMPKKIYENQLFPVTVKGPENNATLIFDTSSTTQPLFSNPLVTKNAQDTFYTYYFKAKKSDIHIPILFITSGTTQTSLDARTITLAPLKAPKDFSGVLATTFKIKGQQVSNYDDKNHMVTLSIEAHEANLEDMALQNSHEFGVEQLQRNHAKVTAEFYAVLPREQKGLHFTYFNTVKKRYISVNIPINVVNASVTTQSDLNPKVDAFEKLKKYALIGFSLFFLLMFVWKRDFFYLILGVVASITLLTFYIPHKQICVKQGAPLYILPTQTSTIGTRISQKFNTMLLGERGNFKKIEYQKGIIGWIKNEDLCEN